MMVAIATPATTARRRAGHRSRLPVAPVVARSPVLLEIVSHSVLHIGYVGQPRAKHLLKIPALSSPSLSSSSATAAVNGKEYYRIYSPIIQIAFHSLGQDPKERSVIVLLDNGGLSGMMMMHQPFQQALERILLQDARVPACSFHSSLQMVPTAFPPSLLTPVLSQQQEQQSGMLIVQLTLQEVHCVAYAAGHVLDFTYQVCCDNEGSFFRKEICQTPETLEGLAQKQASWIDGDSSLGSGKGQMSSLTRALLQCIDACPREMRRAVVHNMVFVGTIADPQFGVKAAKQLRTVLLKHQLSSSPSKAHHSKAVSDDSGEKADVEHQAAAAAAAATTLGVQWISTPVNIQSLKPLAEHVSVIQLGSLRPDLVAWLGASVWASHWHGIDPESANFQWIRRKSSSS